MTKFLLFTGVLAISSMGFTQGNFIPNLNPTPGPVGFGLTAPPMAGAHHLQIHGTTDYCVLDNGDPQFPLPESTSCFGMTSRLSMTNSTTGEGMYDGMLLRMSGLSFYFNNQENENISFKTGGSFFSLKGSTNDAWFGASSAVSGVNYGAVNIQTSSNNGLYIKTTNSNSYGMAINTDGNSSPGLNVVTNGPNSYGMSISTDAYGSLGLKINTAAYNSTGIMINTNHVNSYGIRIQSTVLNGIAISVLGGSNTNFVVQSNGFVFARKYTTTLANIPDYVFKPNYNLMPLSDLRHYIEVNQHLPNIPSAKEYEETGVDLGELNRLLLEKTEELTLYILQLEERMRKLEKEK